MERAQDLNSAGIERPRGCDHIAGSARAPVEPAWREAIMQLVARAKRVAMRHDTSLRSEKESEPAAIYRDLVALRAVD